jgi:hypothetical protein
LAGVLTDVPCDFHGRCDSARNIPRDLQYWGWP